MPKITLTREEAAEIIEEAQYIRDRIVNHDRWTIQHEIIFQQNDRLFRFTYRVGATEYQDQDWFDHSEEVVCREVIEFPTIDYCVIPDELKDDLPSQP